MNFETSTPVKRQNQFIAENKKFSRFLDRKSETYEDPNYEYALLDNSHSDVQFEFSCNSTSTITSKTSNLVESENFTFTEGENFTFTEAVLNFIKVYSNSNLVENDNLENNIDWLNSEIDFVSEVRSNTNDSHITDFDNEELDIEISNHQTDEVLEQCIELDSLTINCMIKQNQLKILETLSICKLHFNFDKDSLHEHGRRYEIHSWTVLGQNIYLSYIGLKNCLVFNSELLIKQATNNTQCHFICSEYFILEGGHFYQYCKRGKTNLPKSYADIYTKDNSKSLELIGRWLLSIANTDNNHIKNKLFNKITNALINVFKLNYENNQSETNNIEPPSQLLLKITLHFQNNNINKLNNQEHISIMIEKQLEQFG
ncbi:5687_t:CDS:2 [Scutellospora calospora]|uniref:5687_t:CDS:1 n=1 Tax=Scutellospora calospora TaxID=85575 RepID=A0ACA9KRK2_9GLOM|nr:5687_t:CDS:2 [Scutellospora calospora]